MAAAGGHVTVRVTTGPLPPQDSAARRVDLLASVSALARAGTVGLWPVRVVPLQKLPVPSRVCAIRRTEEAIRIALEAICMEARRKGRQVQPSTLQFARYVIVFATFLAAEFPAAAVLEWFRLRWQVAQVCKRFRSLARLGHSPMHNDDSAKAWLCGKLLMALLVEKLIHRALAISPWGYESQVSPTAQRLARVPIRSESGPAGYRTRHSLGQARDEWHDVSRSLAEPPRKRVNQVSNCLKHESQSSYSLWRWPRLLRFPHSLPPCDRPQPPSHLIPSAIRRTLLLLLTRG